MKKSLICSSFVLKIIAIVTMTLDHIGVYLTQFPSYSSTYTVGYIFRIIGRIAFPLFAFMLVEGALHTKNWKRYLSRLLSLMVLVLVAQIVLDYGFHYKINQGNIFIDLSLGLIMIVCFENKKKIVKLLGILPILYGFISLLCYYLEYKHLVSNLQILWFPYFIRCQYYFLSIFLILAIYLCYKLLPRLYKMYGLNPDLNADTLKYRIQLNLLASLCLLFFTCVGIVLDHFSLACWPTDIQSYMILAIAPIMLYNGRRGYNSKWFKICTYLYYPVHLVIIAAIFFVIL